ncbi:FMR1-interacting protein NUFIP2 [Eucyclogobius newberryi]|uniref:FMR1-interacting protein NUFIP2 n=1 Tax=Eucyclogobius newberryi TaxID=166745 RepID=UPI003B5BCBA8
MEEQPKDRAQGKHQHGADRLSTQHTAGLKHDQSHSQRQHQETNTKKTGSTKLNIKEREKNLNSSDIVGMSHPTNGNGSRLASTVTVKQKSSQRLYMTVPKTISKALDHKRNMDLKNDKDLDLNHHDDQSVDNTVVLQNGIVNCGILTNGYSSKDNDGSGSEGGYSTSKKQKARCNNVKSTDNVTREKDKQQGNSMQAPGAFSLESNEKLAASRLETFKVPAAARRAVSLDALVGESQRKNIDSKSAGTFGKKAEERHKAKLSSPSKEDSWTLFKPPPVFPVDNSSAKIVPKISYASKVKENLKVAQSAGEGLPPVRLSQVPMSAMKTITSASFSNGPVSGNGCPSGTFFTPDASSIPPAPSVPGGENVASSLESNCSSTSSRIDGEAYDIRKCTLLIYPLNMQPALPSARHLDPPAAQTNQKALGDIFQNQWGLSFINEPNLGPDRESGPVSSADDSSVSVAQSQFQPCFENISLLSDPAMLAQDSEKRTRASSSPVCVNEECKLQQCGQDKPKEEGKAACSVVGLGKDTGAKCAQGPVTTVLFGSVKESTHFKDNGRRCSWGSFDIKAAVMYHTKEMEIIFNLQKQDPKRVVVYSGSKDGPDQ